MELHSAEMWASSFSQNLIFSRKTTLGLVNMKSGLLHSRCRSAYRSGKRWKRERSGYGFFNFTRQHHVLFLYWKKIYFMWRLPRWFIIHVFNLKEKWATKGIFRLLVLKVNIMYHFIQTYLETAKISENTWCVQLHICNQTTDKKIFNKLNHLRMQFITSFAFCRELSRITSIITYSAYITNISTNKNGLT